MVYWCGNKLSEATFNIERLRFFVYVYDGSFSHRFSIFNTTSGKVGMVR